MNIFYTFNTELVETIWTLFGRHSQSCSYHPSVYDSDLCGTFSFL